MTTPKPAPKRKPKPVYGWAEVRRDGTLGNEYGINLAFVWRGRKPPAPMETVRVLVLPSPSRKRKARKR